jgi:hypothetical protein
MRFVCLEYCQVEGEPTSLCNMFQIIRQFESVASHLCLQIAENLNLKLSEISQVKDLPYLFSSDFKSSNFYARAFLKADSDGPQSFNKSIGGSKEKSKFIYGNDSFDG